MLMGHQTFSDVSLSIWESFSGEDEMSQQFGVVPWRSFRELTVTEDGTPTYLFKLGQDLTKEPPDSNYYCQGY